MRLQRGLSEIYTVCFLTFTIPCNWKLFVSAKSLNKPLGYTIFKAEFINQLGDCPGGGNVLFGCMYQGYKARKDISEVYASCVLQCTVTGR